MRLAALLSGALNRQRYTLTATDAQGGQAFLGVTFDHLVQQSDENPATGASNWVAEGDGAAVDVDLTGVPVEFLTDRQRLRGKGFVGFDQVQVPRLMPYLSTRFSAVMPM